MKPNGEEFEQTPEFVLKVAFLGRGELFRSAQAVREAARLALDALNKHGYKIIGGPLVAHGESPAPLFREPTERGS